MKMIQPYRDQVQSLIDAMREDECPGDIAWAAKVASGPVREPVPDAFPAGQEEWRKLIGAWRSLYDAEREEMQRLRDESAH